RLNKLLHITVPRIFLCAILFSAGAIEMYGAQNPVSGVCVAFAKDGALATGTLRNGELETKLYERDTVTATTQEAITGFMFGGLSQSCEEQFSNDGKWLATVVPGSDLLV